MKDQATSPLIEQSRPTSRSRFEWERYRFWLIARAMLSGEVTPIEAAEQADRVIGKDWPLELGESARSKGAHPGGMHPEDTLHWIVMARVETEGEPLAAKPDERLTLERARQAVELYDPEFRQANVILGRGGPSHLYGLFQPPVGKIESIEFDGHFLWGLVRDDGFNLWWAIESGAHDRSIQVQPDSELDERGWYIEHLALLYAEMPVQPNLPSLKQFAGAVYSAESEQPLTRSAGWAGRLHLYGGETMKDPKDQNQEPSLEGLSDEQKPVMRSILDWVDQKLTRSASPSGPDPKPEAKPEAPKPEASPEVNELKSQIESLTRAVEDQNKRLEAKGKAEAEARMETRKATIKRSLDSLVRTCQLSPADAKGWEARLSSESYPEAEVQPTLDQLARVPADPRLSRSFTYEVEGKQPIVENLSPNDLRSPDGAYSVRDEDAQRIGQIRALARSRTHGKPDAEFRAEVSRIIRHGDPELVSVN